MNGPLMYLIKLPSVVIFRQLWLFTSGHDMQPTFAPWNWPLAPNQRVCNCAEMWWWCSHANLKVKGAWRVRWVGGWWGGGWLDQSRGDGLWPLSISMVSVSQPQLQPPAGVATRFQLRGKILKALFKEIQSKLWAEMFYWRPELN